MLGDGGVKDAGEASIVVVEMAAALPPILVELMLCNWASDGRASRRLRSSRFELISFSNVLGDGWLALIIELDGAFELRLRRDRPRGPRFLIGSSKAQLAPRFRQLVHGEGPATDEIS